MPDPRNRANFEESCPYCGSRCWCDLVDVGVGYVQSGPYHCDNCYASEAGPYDDAQDRAKRMDPKTGWYPPGEMPGTSANMLDGKLATVSEMKTAYKSDFINNPLYYVKGVVEEWFKRHRERK